MNPVSRHLNGVGAVLRVPGETIHHTSDAILELNVLGGVDERIDVAASEHQYTAEVVEPVKNKKNTTQVHDHFKRRSKNEMVNWSYKVYSSV